MASSESRERYRLLREGTPFGTNGFGLQGLRQGMATRREPGDPAVARPSGHIPRGRQLGPSTGAYSSGNIPRTSAPS